MAARRTFTGTRWTTLTKFSGDVGVRATHRKGGADNDGLTGSDGAAGAGSDHLFLRFGLRGLRPSLRELRLRLFQPRRILGVVDLRDQAALGDSMIVKPLQLVEERAELLGEGGGGDGQHAAAPTGEAQARFR